MIVDCITEAVANGASKTVACKATGLAPRTLQRWHKMKAETDLRSGPKTRPRNAFSEQERADLIKIVNSPEYRSKSPKQIVPLLADEGIHLGSESTIYRLLRAEKQVKHREPSRAPEHRHRPAEYLATGPNQVWTWDITYLKTTVRGIFYYLYMTVDVWSRKVVGFTVHAAENSSCAAQFMAAACYAEGVSKGTLVLHSDNGSPMKGATMLARLQQLGVAASFSRPSVSNDNPFSEALFRTAKYRPDYPTKPFESLDAARDWAASFVRWYNTEHLHSAIRFVTPESRHAGADVKILEARADVYREARNRNPDRWSKGIRNWTPPAGVTLNPEPNSEVPAGF